METNPIFQPTFRKSFAFTIPLEYTIVHAGAATAVKYPNADAMAVTNPICKVSLPKFIVIGPNTATVAELESTLAKVVVIIITIVSATNGIELIIGPIKSTIELASQTAAPVDFIFDPSDMVEPNKMITPQWVFLFKSSHRTKPATRYNKTPVSAIVPRPTDSLRTTHPAKTIKNIKAATVFRPVISADFAT